MTLYIYSVDAKKVAGGKKPDILRPDLNNDLVTSVRLPTSFLC